MYGISSFMISHHAWFRSDQQPAWQPVFDREYQRAVPEGADLRETARAILKDVQLEGAFWVQRPKPDKIEINRFRFWDETRLTYSIHDHRLRAERQGLRWDQIVLRMHFRGGFLQPTLRDDLWACLVDVACAAIVIWVISGLILWWRVVRLRLWGTIALGSGVAAFAWFLWRL
jgi:hypothetical protein